MMNAISVGRIVPVFLALALSIPGGSPAALADEVRINVTLKPAGSFVARSEAVQVKGATTRDDGAVQARDIVLDLETLKTGIDLRDQHMRKKYFETEKYPQAVLKNASGKDGKFTGELEVHGVTQPIAGTYAIQGERFTATFPAKLTDFNISQPKYMGVGVEDDVTVQVELPAKSQGTPPAKAPAAADAPASSEAAKPAAAPKAAKKSKK